MEILTPLLTCIAAPFVLLGLAWLAVYAMSIARARCSDGVLEIAGCTLGMMFCGLVVYCLLLYAGA